MFMLSCGVSLAGFVAGIWSFCKINKHLLSSLLSLEFVMLNVFWAMSNCLVISGGEIFFNLFFLSVAACEGALALGLVVCISRSHGSDDFSLFSTVQC